MGDLLSHIKDLRLIPLWVLAGLSVACNFGIFYQPIRSELPLEVIPWLYLGALLFSVLALARFIDWLLVLARKKSKAPCLISFAPIQNRSFWHRARQPDGRWFTQVNCSFLATNQSSVPIGLSNPKILSSPIGLGRRTLHLDVLIESPNSKIYGSTEISKYALLPNVPQIVALHGFIETTPWFLKSGLLRMRIEITDTLGNKHRVAVELKFA